MTDFDQMPPIHPAPARGVGRHLRARQRLRRGIYVLPSLFTLGNVFLGFVAVIEGLDGHFIRAALLIFSAGLLDALDGRIARLTGTESEFGMAFDSLADVLTFGSAPALLAYLWGLGELGRMGWLTPLFFLVCTTTRLARFNVQKKSVDSRFFIGLPAPAGGASIVSLLIVLPHANAPALPFQALLAGALFVVGTLMVSTFRYPSFKNLDLRKRRSFRLLIPLTVVLILAADHPEAFCVSLAVLYTCYGPGSWLAGRVRARWRLSAERSRRKHQTPNPP